MRSRAWRWPPRHSRLDPTMLWVLLFVAASDGLTVAGIAALATGSEDASRLVPPLAALLAMSIAALCRSAKRDER